MCFRNMITLAPKAESHSVKEKELSYGELVQKMGEDEADHHISLGMYSTRIDNFGVVWYTKVRGGDF